MSEEKHNHIRVTRATKKELDKIGRQLKKETGGHFFGGQVVEELIKVYKVHKGELESKKELET